MADVDYGRAERHDSCLIPFCELDTSSIILVSSVKCNTVQIFSYTVYVKGVGIAMGYRLDSLGLILGSTRFFSFPQYPDQVWGPPILLFNGYQGSFSRDISAGA
jgi:hypothetical protein